MQFEFTGTARLQQDDVHTSHTIHTSTHTNGTHSPPTDTDTDADSGSGSMYSSGVASFDSSSAATSLGSTAAATAAAAAPLPLEAEVHWRLYQNAEFLRAHMQALVTNHGLNLQDFMFHVLRNCYVVGGRGWTCHSTDVLKVQEKVEQRNALPPLCPLPPFPAISCTPPLLSFPPHTAACCCCQVVMTARDEASSFRIFSTLNSRGVDLSEVDKLKADLLQV